MMETETIILGGGVAGLAAARRLIELGIKPLVIEAGTYPSHKVCGEFFSPSSQPLLKRWDLNPIPLDRLCMHTLKQKFEFKFPSPAGALSHLTLDTQLAEQITSLGATLLTRTKVDSLTQSYSKNGKHLIHLTSGEKITAKNLLIATGRLTSPSTQAPNICYAGLKAHFSGIELNSRLEMFSFPNAYLGLAPIENGLTNLACLTTIENFKKFSSANQFMGQLIDSHPDLRNLISAGTNLFDAWMEAFIPEFGLRSPPDWPGTYWIGDAAGTIPPASGNGLSLALASGCLAADFASRNDAVGFKKAWKKRCASQIFYGKCLHKLFLNPTWGNCTLRAGRVFPSIARKLFSLSRE